MESTNEPVAWMSPDGRFSTTEGKLFYIPLYTTPQIKELSDEEIIEILMDKYEKGHGRYADTNLFYIEFAKAILKKASEK